MGLQARAQNITPEAFQPRAPRDETVRIHPCGPMQPPPNLAAGIQSLSFNRSRWHPVASLRPDHPLNVAPGGAAVRWRTPCEAPAGFFHCVSQRGSRNLRIPHFLQPPVVNVQQSSHERHDFGMFDRDGPPVGITSFNGA